MYLATIFTSAVTKSPSGPIQGSMISRRQFFNCTVSTVGAVESNSVSICWLGPEGNVINNNDNKVTIIPTISSGNTYTSSLQFHNLQAIDEGTYTCNVVIVDTNESQSASISSKLKLNVLISSSVMVGIDCHENV